MTENWGPNVQPERSGGGQVNGSSREKGAGGVRWREVEEIAKQITQHCAIFCNQKSAKRQSAEIGRESGLKGRVREAGS